MAGQTRMSRDDYKKHKELEELRKTGAAPPAVDDDGKMINPHIPQYISQAPWYLNSNKPGLKHQYPQSFAGSDTKKFADIKTEYQRGKRKAGELKFKKGACKNCGATTHKEKDCVERPRLKNAKVTGTVTAGNDIVQDLNFDYEGKRDRWRGYDPATYQRVIDTYERTEAERKAAKKRELDAELSTMAEDKAERKKKRREERKKEKEAAKLAKREAKAKRRADRDAQRALDDKGSGTAAAAAAPSSSSSSSSSSSASGAAAPKSESDSSDSDVASDSDSDSDSDEEGGAGDLDKREMDDKGVMHQRLDTKNRTTVRNLRIREDTAKYLRNLNINSAHYDPKTRSMRENPYPNKDPKDLLYAGDNFVRHSGDAKAITDAQRFVWDANDKGVEEINILSNPSQAEAMFSQYQEKKQKLKDKRKTEVLSKYGGEQYLAKDDAEKDLLLMQSEHYVEYSEDGRVIKGQEKAVPKTKYVEDVFENNHKAVWGSFFEMTSGRWGYGCCQQTTRHSFCTGEAGKKARAEAATDLKKKEGMAFKPVVAGGAEGTAAAAASSSSSSASSASTPAVGESKDRKLAQAVGDGLVRSLHGDAAGDAAYQDKLSKAIKAEKARQSQVGGAAAGGDKPTFADLGNKKGKPKYNAHYDSAAPTEEEMEAHRMLQARADDPMAKYLSQ